MHAEPVAAVASLSTAAMDYGRAAVTGRVIGQSGLAHKRYRPHFVVWSGRNLT
jgi:hypothetical protein